MKGNRETCPRCGEWAELPDGTFNIVGETIEVLSAPDLTRERLLRLAEILRTASEGGISEEDAAQAVAEEAPALAPLFDQFGPVMKKALIYFLLTVINLLAAQALAEHRDHSATKQDVQSAVEQAIDICRGLRKP